MRIFNGNIGQYFAEWEIRDFEEFLDLYASKLPYFVVIDKDEVVACGGYDRENSIATLSWGMVECSRHGESIGKYLLLHRLNGIRKDYGSITVKIYTSQHTQGFYQKYSFVPTSVEKKWV